MIIAGCDALPVFEAREHDLDAAAAPVAAFVVLDRLVAGSPAQDAGLALLHYVRRLPGAAWGTLLIAQDARRPADGRLVVQLWPRRTADAPTL